MRIIDVSKNANVDPEIHRVDGVERRRSTYGTACASQNPVERLGGLMSL